MPKKKTSKRARAKSNTGTLKARAAIVGFSLLSLVGFLLFLPFARDTVSGVSKPSISTTAKSSPPVKAKPHPLRPEQSPVFDQPVNLSGRRAPAPLDHGLSKAPPVAVPPPPLALNRPLVAVVIDDIGYQWPQAVRLAHLDQHLTLAILPFSPFGQKIAVLAQASGKEVILHAPMEPHNKSQWDGGLTNDMDQHELSERLGEMLDWLPHVQGVNNHMGSHFTTGRERMDTVMQTLSKRQLYFLDSRTSPLTQGLFAAQAHKIPSTKRDIFLDNVRDPQAIAEQFNKLIAIAVKQGYAVGIGHPYPETVSFLEQNLSKYATSVTFVPLSILLNHPAPSLGKR